MTGTHVKAYLGTLLACSTYCVCFRFAANTCCQRQHTVNSSAFSLLMQHDRLQNDIPCTDRSQESAEEPETWAVVLDVSRNSKDIGQLKLDLAANQRCVFGRQPGGCDVVLEHLSISRQHAHLSMDVQGRCFVTDMASGEIHQACFVYTPKQQSLD